MICNTNTHLDNNRAISHQNRELNIFPSTKPSPYSGSLSVPLTLGETNGNNCECCSSYSKSSRGGCSDLDFVLEPLGPLIPLPRPPTRPTAVAGGGASLGAM